MTTERPPEGLPTFFAEQAFAKLRVGAVAIRHDVEQLQDISDLVQDELGLGLTHAVQDSVMVYRFGEPGRSQEVPDPVLTPTRPNVWYVPASALAAPPDSPVPQLNKSEVLQAGRPVEVQVQARDIGGRLVRAYAQSMMWPPAQDHRFLADPGAWGRQIGSALAGLGFMPGRQVTEPGKLKLLREVTERYPDAIVLEPRKPAS